jgi:hypothetical protein
MVKVDGAQTSEVRLGKDRLHRNLPCVSHKASIYDRLEEAIGRQGRIKCTIKGMNYHQKGDQNQNLTTLNCKPI